MMTDGQNENETEGEVIVTDPSAMVPAISHENLNKPKSSVSRFVGIFCILLASLLFTLSNFVIKQLKVDFFDALLLRFLLQTVLNFGYALHKKYTLLGGTTRQISLQIVCSVIAASGSVFFLIAIVYAELSDISTIVYTRVVWTVVFSSIVYRERPSLVILVALPMTLAGVVFVTQPHFLFSSATSTIDTDSRYQYIGFISALGTALASCINILLFKELISTCGNIKPSVLTFQYCLASAVALVAYQIYKRSIVLSQKFFLSSAVSTLNIVAIILSQEAIKREHPSVVMLLSSSDIIFALVLQYLFAKIHSNMYTFLGSGLVIASVFILSLGRLYSERRQTHEPVNTNDETCRD